TAGTWAPPPTHTSLEVRDLTRIERPFHRAARHAAEIAGDSGPRNLEWHPIVVGGVENEGQMLASGYRDYLHRSGSRGSRHREACLGTVASHRAVDQVFLSRRGPKPQPQRALRPAGRGRLRPPDGVVLSPFDELRGIEYQG